MIDEVDGERTLEIRQNLTKRHPQEPVSRKVLGQIDMKCQCRIVDGSDSVFAEVIYQASIKADLFLLE
jgi:hypothetical protein